MRLRLSTAITVAICAVAVSPAAPVAASAYSSGDPTTWSSAQLAGQLTHSCVDAANWTAARAQAAAGIGGITLLGNSASPDLAAQLAQVRSAGPSGIQPAVSSDEEGGLVQRLSSLIYPLPSARTMGTWPDAQVEDTAYRYGLRMHALGVSMELAPDADLDVPGAYMSLLQRAFSADPNRVTTAAAAWTRGMQRAGEVPVVKHWPGHGSAPNSHTSTAPVVPPLPVLEARDMVPFDASFIAGAPAVMVGQLESAGLTEPGLPATLSPNAMRYLRERTGPDTVIMTDSLTMAPSTVGVGLTAEQAAVRALQAGADWALTCAADPLPTVVAIGQAIDSGALPRAQAVASVLRILDLKAGAGLLDPPVVHPPIVVIGAIGQKYLALGGPAGLLGAPLTNEFAVAGGRAQRFASGEMFWSPATGGHEVHGSILAHYLAIAGPAGRLGLPVTDELAIPGGRSSAFQVGSMYWSPTTDAWSVQGLIRQEYDALGGPASLGLPLNDETTTPDGVGRYNHFSGGRSIYWTPGTGAHAVIGAIRVHWEALGWERGLGYPLTDELATPGGRLSEFQNGTIYWSPSSGPWSVVGAIRARYRELGDTAGALGFPVSDEFAVPGGRRSNFTGGALVWNAATGQVTLA